MLWMLFWPANQSSVGYFIRRFFPRIHRSSEFQSFVPIGGFSVARTSITNICHACMVNHWSRIDPFTLLGASGRRYYILFNMPILDEKDPIGFFQGRPSSRFVEYE